MARIAVHIAEAVWNDDPEYTNLKNSTVLRSGKAHPWTCDCETSFRDLKRLIVTAVDLYTPNLRGARDGTFPYLIWPDASGYGVGAGCFQHGLHGSIQCTRPPG